MACWAQKRVRSRLAKVGYCVAVLATGPVALNSLASVSFLLGVNSKTRRPLVDLEVLLHCGIFLAAVLACTYLFGVWPFRRFRAIGG